MSLWPGSEKPMLGNPRGSKARAGQTRSTKHLTNFIHCSGYRLCSYKLVDARGGSFVQTRGINLQATMNRCLLGLKGYNLFPERAQRGQIIYARFRRGPSSFPD